jgi:hypothetical protein
MTQSSNLTRFHPRPAAIAAGTPLGQHQQAVRRVQQAIDSRKRLPRTQIDFYAERLRRSR